ncbi:MAG: hypothetical protein A8274_1267 [Halanaerobium sp. 4-GBenrich]|nr:MAG: hypothetical protein A8274_1267 [Halanaerobium sp. 4-GBenrich]
MIAASAEKGTANRHICRSCSLFRKWECSGSDLGSGLFHTTGTVNLTVITTTMEKTFRSSGQNTEVFSTFSFFLTPSTLFFSEHRNAISSALARQGLVVVPIVFRSCFCSGTFVKNRNAGCFPHSAFVV